MANSLEHMSRSYINIYCFLEGDTYSVFLPGTPWSSDAPTSKKSSGMRSGDVRSHSSGPRQQRQWPANCLSNCARKYHTTCMETFGSFCTVTITGLYDPQTTATEYVSIWHNVKLLWSGSWEMGKITRSRSCDPKEWFWIIARSLFTRTSCGTLFNWIQSYWNLATRLCCISSEALGGQNILLVTS